MSVSIPSLRLAVAAVLSLPILPMCWIAGTGYFAGTASTACAQTVGCNTCTYNTCGPVGYNETHVYVNTTYLNRCIDYDNLPPGHCAYVMRNNFNVLYVNRYGYYTIIRKCVKEECASSIINQDSACDRPLYIAPPPDDGGISE